mgnify:CR=1 FL=1
MRGQGISPVVKMDFLILAFFSACLLVCLSMGYSILYALTVGLVIFLGYGLYQGFAFSALLKMCVDGIKTTRNILITFLLIGLLTAFWRASGTIAVIVSYATAFVSPSWFLLAAFLLNALVSVLIGTSFGTVATMGVICLTMGNAMQLPPLLIGGAIISGIYVGDRCSPVSTSALLVSELTETNLFDNIRNMVKTAYIPFGICSLIYLGLGYFLPYEAVNMDLAELLSKEFNLNYLAFIPALLVLGLSLYRVPVKLTLGVSIVAAIVLSVYLQDIVLVDLGNIALYGYYAKDTEVARMLNGGGALGMARLAVIILISSCYAGIFKATGLLDRVKEKISVFAKNYTSFGAMLLASIITGAIACNQTLTIILTYNLCKDLDLDKNELAVNLENTAVLVAPMFPWSLAVAMPLATLGTGDASVLFAFFLYVVPLWRLGVALFNKGVSHGKVS